MSPELERLMAYEQAASASTLLVRTAQVARNGLRADLRPKIEALATECVNARETVYALAAEIATARERIRELEAQVRRLYERNERARATLEGAQP